MYYYTVQLVLTKSKFTDLMSFNENEILLLTESTQKASIYLDKWSALAHSLPELTKQIAGIADQPL